jgi:hypothetical protein
MQKYRPKATIEAFEMQDGLLGREALRTWLGSNHGVKATKGQWVLKNEHGAIHVMSDTAFRAQFEEC